MSGISEAFFKEQMDLLRNEISTNIAGLKTSLTAEIMKLREDAKDARDALETKMEDRITKLENRLDDEVTKLNDTLNAKEDSLMELIQENYTKLNKDYQELKKRVVFNEDHGRRLNLVIGGSVVPKVQSPEQCVNQFFINTLQIPRETVDQFTYRAVHHLGKPKQYTIQPIICAFTKQQHRDLVMRNAYRLKDFEQLSIRPNYSKETSIVRDNLMVTRKQLKTAGYKVRVTEKKYYPVLQICENGGQWTEYKERDADGLDLE